MKLAPLALALTLTTSAFAQATFTDPANLRGERVRPSDGRELPVDQGASGLQQLLRKLNTRASLMLIVAHPDDEDGGMLTYYSRGLGARVAVLTLNRGEGGQNAMTGDFEDALGLLRTQELLSADRYFDVDQMFGTEVDFGFSKTKEEAFAKWTHERVLYDAVRAVRLYRPLVIASVFVGGVTDGHGQHQVSGEIAQEVFNAAGDPKVFPELTAEGILPWQPLKVYARVPMQSITPQGLFDYATGQYTPAKFTNYVTGEVTTTEPSVDVVVHEGTPDPLLGGKSYVQFARVGLGLQKSQIGPGVRTAPAGAFDISYHRYGSRLDSSATTASANGGTFFDGIDTTLQGIANLAPEIPSIRVILSKLQERIWQATQVASEQPSKAIPYLTSALLLTDSFIQQIETQPLNAREKGNVLHELRVKRVQLNDALALALGLTMDASTTEADNIAGSRVRVVISMPVLGRDKRSPDAVWIENSNGERFDVPSFFAGARDYAANPPETSSPEAIDGSPLAGVASSAVHLEASLDRSFTSTVSRPYFFRDNIEQPVYELREKALRNAPQTPAALVAGVECKFQGVPIVLYRVVHAGDQSARLIPLASLTLGAHAQVLPDGESTIRLAVSASLARTWDGVPRPGSITTQLELPSGWKWKAAKASEPWTVELSAPLVKPALITAKATAIADSSSTREITEGYRPIGYGDLPRTNYYTPATVRIVPVDLKVPTRNRIAYLPGTGDSVPEALASIGLTPIILSVADLTPAKLTQFDTVILGVRTYNAHPDLHGAPTQALFDFARNGGNVIVQFQTPEFTTDDAPFPVTLGRAEVVVDETAPVQILEPTSPIFTTPNKITTADFNNWVEERGHGFLRSWDAHYTALTETHDPGGPETQQQAPQRGGLITTPLGKGRWTYCAFALYRQLPEAVPGAYRLFVNLLNP